MLERSTANKKRCWSCYNWKDFTKEKLFEMKTEGKVEHVNKTDWIPVSERLPDDGVPVICTLKNYPKWVGAHRYAETVVAFMFKWNWIILTTSIFYDGCNYVTAWMPLPVPYEKDNGGIK